MKGSQKFFYNPNLKKYARELRKNLTEAEKLLWSRLRKKQLKGYRFHRQRIIGNYIVDFYCPRAKLVIEVDGGQHYEKNGKIKDKIRDKYLKSIGLRVLRFSDCEVLLNLVEVLEVIYKNLL